MRFRRTDQPFLITYICTSGCIEYTLQIVSLLLSFLDGSLIMQRKEYNPLGIVLVFTSQNQHKTGWANR